MKYSDNDLTVSSDDDDPIKITDHFSLENPSSSIRLGEKTSYIFTDGQGQFIMENTGNNNIRARQSNNNTIPLLLIRAFYTMVATLMAGFLFLVCLELIMFLFMGLFIESGLTSKQDLHPFTALGTFLSLPVFCVSLANAMNVAFTFVGDTWNGHHLTMTIIAWQSVLTNWLTFLTFLFVPLMVGIVCLFSSNPNWWEITSITWISCIFLYYLFFLGSVIYFEVYGCYQMMRYNKKFERSILIRNLSSKNEFFAVIKRAVFLRQSTILAGTKHISYIVTGSNYDFTSKEYIHDSSNQVSARRENLSIISKLTCWLAKCGLYEKLESPVRLYDPDEVGENISIVTNYSWELEKLYFRDRDEPIIMFIKGENSVSRSQAISSLVCLITGKSIIFFTIISFLVWLKVNWYIILIVVLLLIFSVKNRLITAYSLWKIFKKKMVVSDACSLKEEIIHEVREEYKVTQPCKALCWGHLILEVNLLFIIPTIALFITQNYVLSVAFVLMASITFVRKHMDPTICFRALGTTDGIEKNNTSIYTDEEWREKHRLSKIVREISHGDRNNFWVRLFFFFILFFCSLAMTAITFEKGDDVNQQLRTLDLDEFIYKGNSQFSYPSCSLNKGIETLDSDETNLADFIFLSTLAYQDRSMTQNSLNDWFGNNTAIDMDETVEAFRKEYEDKHQKSAVSYKLIDFPGRNLNVVVIRGTTNSWDAITDIQLWQSAIIAQCIRAVIPIGEIWTPIFRHLVHVISLIESENLKRVSFYKQTTAFVEMLKSQQKVVALTGHSLGGGLAMISGAQTKTPALAVSGPNSMISQYTFSPKLSKDDIDKYTFNIVPDRDPVPRIDDLAQNYQRITCRSDLNHPFNCHHATRSLCEILYSCGSQGIRPVLCICHEKYGFPKPLAIGTKTFEDACS